MIKYVIFFSLFFFLNLKGSLTSNILETIPAKDREDLKYLFHNIFLLQHGAYVIFGDKPISSAAFFLIPAYEATLTGYPVKFASAWKTWQKYKHLFPMKNYAIVSEKLPSKKSGNATLYIYVINKKNFIKTLGKNLSFFEAILQTKIDSQKFLDELVTEKTNLLMSICKNEMLFGILLGYGEHNSYLYEKFMHARKAFFLFPKKIYLKNFGDCHPFFMVNSVQFRIDEDHFETKILKKKYKNLHKKISKIYSQGDMLEITLSQLCM